jgi:UMF1 family MFS transporter
LEEFILTHIKKINKKELSWILYDCGNSAYSMAITTALFPVYFGIVNNGNNMDYGYFTSIASIVVAILSPILGTIADYENFKKRFFIFFSMLGIITTGFLPFVPTYEGNVSFLVIIYILTSIGFAGANVFYDSFLVDVTKNNKMDSISTKGFAFGYISSVIPFAISLFVIFKLGMGNILGYQIGFMITSLWWGLLTIPLIKNVNQVHCIKKESGTVLKSFLRLKKTFLRIKEYKHITIFLLAYFLYIDGVDTIFKMAVPFAQQTLGLDPNDTFILLGILLVIQLIAFPFAILYGILADKYGARKLIYVAIITYILSVFFAFFMFEMWHIFILGSMIGSAQGGIQALSRSYYAKIIPKKNSNEFFGFYNIFGKFAAILGPALMSLTNTLTNNPRLSILSIIPLFLSGLIVFNKVPKNINTNIESIS